MRRTSFRSIVSLAPAISLFLLSACSGSDSFGPAAPGGVVAIRATITGPGARDYLHVVELGGSRLVIHPDSTFYFEAADGSTQLLGIPPHCSVPVNPVAFVTHPRDTTHVEFKVSCGPDAALEIAAVGPVIGERPLLAGFDASGGRAVVLAEGHSPAWSPDGSRLAYLAASWARERVWVLDLESGTRSSPGDEFVAGAWTVRPAWSSDGRRIAVAAGEKILLVPAAGGAPAVELSPGAGAVRGVDWSPAGDSLVAVTDSGVVIVAADGSGSLAIAGTRMFLYLAPSWSPDGNWIAFARTITRGLGGCFGCAAGDGWDFFGSRAAGPTGDELYIAATDGSAPRLLAATASDGGFAWSADGALIAFTGADLEVYVAAPAGEVAPRSLGVGIVPSWTADRRIRAVGDLIHTVAPDGTDRRLVAELSMLSMVGPYAEWRP